MFEWFRHMFPAGEGADHFARIEYWRGFRFVAFVGLLIAAGVLTYEHFK